MGKLDLGSPWISRALPQDFQGCQCGKPGMGADAAPHPLGGKQEANMTFPPPSRQCTGLTRDSSGVQHPTCSWNIPSGAQRGKEKRKQTQNQELAPCFQTLGGKTTLEERGGEAEPVPRAQNPL